AGGRRQIREVTAGQSGNQSPSVLHFGLGDEAGPASVKVRFPSGRVGTWRAEADETLVVLESQAGISDEPR
ncbi:ASPIC/UnbV domain-containing protein, partial [Bacillus sp. SIMBA_161]